MKGTIKPTAGILFILSILLPSLFLGYFALRAVDREEAYIEKRFEDTLSANVVHTTGVILDEVNKIKDELTIVFTSISLEKTSENLDGVKEKTRLIDIPFLVSDDFTIIHPDPQNPGSKADTEFLSSYEDFLSNKLPVPVYENIAIAYKDVINDQLSVNDITSNLNNNASDKDFEGLLNNDKIQDLEEYMNQSAKIQFEQNEDIRNKVYEQAAEEGNALSQRNVVQSQKKEDNPESVFISRHRIFSEIIQGRSNGFIPRIINDSLTLFFWVKLDSGYMSGCSVNMGVFKNRLLKCIQQVFTRVRILTILDENGIPFIVPGESSARNWKIPFVSQEISEVLPRWEVAAYLSDPSMISSQARSTGMIMWILIFIFVISIVIGGILILKSFYSEILLAEQKTTFVSNVSHELKTPLTSIRLFAEMLKEDRQPDIAKQKKYLGLMVSETERLSQLINNVLDFSKMGQKKKQYTMDPLEITGFCSGIMENQRLGLEEKGFNLQFSSAIRDVMVNADSASLKQAILNLISNAEKYSPDIKEITMNLTRADGYVRIELRDRGIGIPINHTGKIFKEFYRVDDSLTARVGGSGLGLAIVKKIIIAHEGSIHYKPRDGGGSIFVITLPILGDERIKT